MTRATPPPKAFDTRKQLRPLYGLLLGAGLTIIGLLAYSGYGDRRIGGYYLPLLNAAVSGRLAVATAHLPSNGPPGEARDGAVTRVLADYTRTQRYLQRLLEGDRPLAGPGDGPVREQLEAMRDDLAAILEAVRQQGPSPAPVPYDRAYASTIQGFVRNTDALIASLWQGIEDTRGAILTTQSVLALAVVLLLGFVATVLHRVGRSARASIGELETARQRAELGEARYRTLVDNIDLGVTLIDRDHRIVMANPARGKLFGREPESFVGKECFREFENRDSACSHCPGILAMETGRKQAVETEGIRDDGSPLFMHVRAFPVLGGNGAPTGFIEVVEDVTERRLTQRELAKAEATLRGVVQAAPVGIGLVTDRVLGWSNDRLQEMTGYGPEELEGRSSRILYPDDREYERVGTEKYAQIAELGTGTVETRWRRRDGTVIDVLLSSTPLDPGDLSAGVVFTALDVTGRKRAETERLALERQIQHAQKLESLGVLAGGIAHDFNNILMGVLGNAELALQRLAPENPAVENLRSIETAAVRAADLARQMLAYSGKGHFVVERLDINRTVEEMTHLLQTVISKKVVLKYDLSENLPPIEADATQIRQVIMNLITNASEAVGDRSGVVTVSTGVVYADRPYLAETFLDEDLSEGYYACIEVADTGQGMTPETRKRIFDPFFTTKFAGRGLGLAAVLGIVRGHRGAIKVYSEPDRGTTFKILFPCGREPEEPTPAPETERAERWSGSGIVLVVDDEESVRALAKMGLERAGFRVFLAEDGREAVRVFQARADEIRAVVLDMTMPHMDGEETYRALRRVDPNVRVILSSGYSEQSVTGRFAGKGLAGFIQKPYRPSELVEKLRAALDGTTGTGPGGGDPDPRA